MDIKEDLASNQTVLLVMSGANYNVNIIKVMEQLSGNICYITANKTYDALKQTLEEGNVNTKNIIFIDTISKTLKKVSDQEGVFYVSSPGALTELSLVIKKFLKHDFDYLVFDAISNLSIYQDANMCTKFLRDLVNNIKKTKTKSVFYVIESSSNGDVIAKASVIVDKVVGEKIENLVTPSSAEIKN